MSGQIGGVGPAPLDPLASPEAEDPAPAAPAAGGPPAAAAAPAHRRSLTEVWASMARAVEGAADKVEDVVEGALHRGPTEAKIREALQKARREAVAIGPAGGRGADRAQAHVAKELSRLADEIQDRARALDKAAAEGKPPAPIEAERARLRVMLDDYAAIGAHLGPHARKAVEAGARALYGREAGIVEAPPGKFALWNCAEKFAPVLVADLPAVGRVDARAFAAATPLPPPPPLGAVAADRAALAGSPALAHLGAALPGGRGGAVKDIFAEGGASFVRAPDPRTLLQGTHAANAARDVKDGVELGVMSYNVALLRYEVFGSVTHSESPLLEERRDDLARKIFDTGDDVILLQEVWRDEEVAILTKAADARGYRAFVSPRTGYTDGLVTFVKKDAIDESTAPGMRARAYEKQDPKEYLAAEITSLGRDTGVKRGYQEVRFRHKALGEVTLFNTHMQPYPDAPAHRMAQGRELGLAASAARADGGVTLLGGDLNASTYYPRDTWTDEKGKTTTGWWKNAISQPLLQHYAGATDLVVAGRPAAEADDDVDGLDAGGPREGVPSWPFTAESTSNRLHDMQYGRSEYPARLDHILGDTAGGRMKVLESEMAFTEDLEVAPGVKSELSDHYAVRTRLLIARPPAGRPAAATTPP